jgi:hypothetical protein
MTSVLELASGHVPAGALHVIADLGVADVLDSTPRTVEELAAYVGASADGSPAFSGSSRPMACSRVTMRACGVTRRHLATCAGVTRRRC